MFPALDGPNPCRVNLVGAEKFVSQEAVTFGGDDFFRNRLNFLLDSSSKQS